MKLKVKIKAWSYGYYDFSWIRLDGSKYTLTMDATRIVALAMFIEQDLKEYDESHTTP